MLKTIGGMVVVVAVIGLVMSAMGSLVATRTINNTGWVQGSSPLGIYSDSGCTSALSSIQWGTLNPGDTATATLYVRNEGDVPVTLSIQATNWNPPSTESYFALGWNLDGVLQPHCSAQALLTLNVSSAVSGIAGFSFDITITATQ